MHTHLINKFNVSIVYLFGYIFLGIMIVCGLTLVIFIIVSIILCLLKKEVDETADENV